MNAEPEPGVEAQVLQSVVEQIEGLLVELRGGSVPHVRPDSDLSADLGLDSLAVVELHDRLEHAFGVHLPEEVLAKADTPTEWALAVLEARGQRGVAPAPRVVPAPPERRPVGEPWAVGAQTLVECMEWHLDAHPQRTAIRLLGTGPGGTDEELTYGSLWSEGARCAEGLLAGGLGPGERVAIMLPTGRDYFVVSTGAMLAGGVPVPIYPPARLSVLEEHLRRQATVLRNAGASVLATVPEALAAARLLRYQVPSLRLVGTVPELVAAGAGRERVRRPAPEDLALIQYTSGSTGDPKGVMLTHTQVLANTRAMGQAVGANSSDVFVSWLPLYHDMGLIGAWHAASLYFGMLLAVMSPLRFLARPATWLEAVTEYRGTISASPDFAFQSCVERVTDEELARLDLSSWRVAFNGSEPVSASTIERFTARFAPAGFRPETMCPAYGLAEVGVGMAFTPLGQLPRVDVIDRAALQRSLVARAVTPDHPGSMSVVGCGRPVPGYEVRVVGEHGEELPERHEGEVECRGPSATSGYFGNAAASAALWRHGWLDTGDRGYLADGEVYLTGRAKDIIIRAGRNLHPEDLELALGELEGVERDGVAVFAVSRPPEATERLVVVVETTVEDEQARDRLRQQAGARAVEVLGAAPDELVLVAPGAISRTPSGKIQRAVTRQAYESGRLGRHPAPVPVQLMRFAWSGLGPSSRRLVRAGADWAFAAYAWLAALAILVPVALALQLPSSLWLRWRLAHHGARLLSRLVGIEVQVHGKLPASGSAVVVVNHASFIDGAVLVAASPEPLTFVTSTDFERHLLAGSFLRRLGSVFVERGAPEAGERDVDRLVETVRRGQRLVLFAEGSLDRAPGIRHFHLGAFAVALGAGCPVSPIGIRGTRAVIRPGTYLPRRGQVEVVAGSPLRGEGQGFDAAVQLAEQSRKTVAALCGEPLVD